MDDRELSTNSSSSNGTSSSSDWRHRQQQQQDHFRLAVFASVTSLLLLLALLAAVTLLLCRHHWGRGRKNVYSTVTADTTMAWKATKKRQQQHRPALFIKPGPPVILSHEVEFKEEAEEAGEVPRRMESLVKESQDVTEL